MKTKIKYKRKIKISHRYLLGAAYRYLERYATTEANLKFILSRKVERALVDQENSEEVREISKIWIKEIVDGCVKQKLVDNKLYAQNRMKSFLNSGNSVSNAKNKLRAKGVPVEVIEEVVASTYKQTPNANIVSAVKYVKRRRFGPFRVRERMENTEQKEFAAMARAGYSYSESAKVLKASLKELENILYEN